MTKILAMLLVFQTVGFDLPLVASLAAIIALPVKGTVDIVKGAWTSLPGGLLPILGFALGTGYAVVVLVAAKQPFDASTAAQGLLAAVTAQLGAMAATGVQNWANEKRS